jgi:hypothetical protein
MPKERKESHEIYQRYFKEIKRLTEIFPSFNMINRPTIQSENNGDCRQNSENPFIHTIQIDPHNLKCNSKFIEREVKTKIVSSDDARAESSFIKAKACLSTPLLQLNFLYLLIKFVQQMLPIIPNS